MFALVLFAFPVAAQTPEPGWIADAKTGCRVWISHPAHNESISWTGDGWPTDCPDGVAQGHGVLQRFRDGELYSSFKGLLRDGKLNNVGATTYANGNRYEGWYSDNRENGWGTYTFAGGNRYVGTWRDGKANGLGVMTRQDGATFEGVWEDGKLHDLVAVTFANRSRYAGGFSDQMANGTGTYTASDGKATSGIWSNGCLKQGGFRVFVGIPGNKECGGASAQNGRASAQRHGLPRAVYIFFASEGAAIETGTQNAVLDDIAAYAKDGNMAHMQIMGYTDFDEKNDKALSLARANAVAAGLTSRGLPSGIQITIAGVGYYDPGVPAPAGDPLNRKVTIDVLP
jgi:hypothetical protein